MNDSISALTAVQDYYGKTLKSNGDLKTSACCTNDSLPKSHLKILELIDDEVLNRFYGCGSPIPDEIEGKTVLDLGCGTGRDVFMVSHLAGETGYAIGIDMTEEQLNIGISHIDSQMKKFGFTQKNVEFKKGYIEDLKQCGIEDNSVDLVISNCVINLSPQKDKVFEEIFRVLKPGGELYFSDVFSDRRVPQDIKSDPILYGECLGGALYIEDFRRLLLNFGCPDYRIMKSSPIKITNEEIEKTAGMINFFSMTIRAFKLDSLEDRCEEYGQMATYKGTIKENPHFFILDDHHTFHKGKPMSVCGNTASMLQDTRFSRHFDIVGDRSVHYGLFDRCSTSSGSNSEDNSSIGSCC